MSMDAGKAPWTAHHNSAMKSMGRWKAREPKKEATPSDNQLGQSAPADIQAEDVQTLIVQNPQMNAASFFALLKSKGFVISKEAQVGVPALDRAGVKPKESIKESTVACRMVESDAGGGTMNGQDRYQNRFRVVLIQEGLGNTRDGYYYTKEALRSAVPVFEGKKFYADHPSKLDEEIRPERSVRDIYGHFENLEYKEAADGTAQMLGDVVVLPDGDSDWIRARLIHAVDFSKKFPDKEFVGLSINASGDAEPMDADTFMREGGVVQSAQMKLQQAINDGLQQVKVVRTIDSAVSCDLVTEAGAKGKVISLLEGNKMKVEKKEAADMEKKEDAGMEKKEGDDAGHDDEAQDKQLIMDMLKKHGLVDGDEEGKDDEGDSKEAEDKEAPPADKKDAPPAKDDAKKDPHADMMQAAMKYHQAYKACGHDSKEAADRACEAMKCAGMAHAGDQKESDKKEEESHKEADKKEHKESAAVIKLKGENAKLVEKLSSMETEKHLDKKLQESRLPMAVTKKFRESIKAAKSIKEVDEKFNLFMEGYKSFGGEADGLGAFVMTEKETVQSAKSISLDDCVEE